jgi:ABC-type nitrate/sulfonate/bicarbonate transport system permease component
MLAMVGTLAGMDSARGPDLAMIRALGGGTWAQLLRCRLPYAAPSLISSMKIAAPTSFVSAVVGEFLVGRGGLGVALINSQQQFVVPRVWSLTLVCAAVSASMYGIVVLLETWLTPWSKDSVRELEEPRRVGGVGLRRAVALAGVTILITAGLIALWQLAITSSGTASIVARSPQQIAEFFGPHTTDPAGRHDVLTALLVTLRHTAIGYLSGALLAIALALVISLLPSLERGILGMAIVARTVPLVALTPLLIILVGSDTSLVVAVGAVSTFFPTLVNLVTGLRLAPSSLVAVPFAAGGGRASVLLRVRVPAAVPYVFAAAKIAVPTAVTGALLAEWFGTGDGLGYLFAIGVSSLNFTPVWAGVVAITLLAIVGYALLEAIEAASRRHFSV